MSKHSIEEMRKAIALYNLATAVFQKDCKVFYQDKANPHSERWEVFRTSGCGEHHNWIQTPPGEWEDRLGTENRERHQVVDVTDLRGYYNYDKIPEEQWQELEEWAMDNNIRSWETDW